MWRRKAEKSETAGEGFPHFPSRGEPALIVPTAEWINPYAGITEDEQEVMMRQAEAPPIPPVEEVSQNPPKDT